MTRNTSLFTRPNKTALLTALSLFFLGLVPAARALGENTQAPAPIREALIVAPEPTVETPPPKHAVFVAPSAAQTEEPAATFPELTALPDDDVWQRIRAGFGMEELASPLVARHEKWYANHPDYVLRMSERAQRYLFHIVEEVERRGMPTEIALLPVIESAFNPGANSFASASGIWQFIPSTGKHFGMEQNWWHDERRDVIGATNGALDYLQKLHDQFGDWHLALAAYNWGENAVARAQAKNRRLGKPTDYAHLKMPRETQNYVPKLLAVKHIVEDPQRFGLTLRPVPNRPYFAMVGLPQSMDAKKVAELAEISMEEFTALNPALNRPVILQDLAPTVLLPVDKVEVFRANLERNDQRLVTWRPYKTEKGESFARIAEDFGISLEDLRRANGLSRFAVNSNGQTLLVPAPEDEEVVDYAAFNLHPTAIQEMAGFTYVVRKGDTISGLARRFHVSQAGLIAMNRGSHRLHIGQRFTILPGAAYPRRAAVKRSGKARSKARVKVAYNRYK
ncbi:MAG: transglycosylase SLT domain-containing protein [Sideroxydans sp.]